jgi:hypothetical protein
MDYSEITNTIDTITLSSSDVYDVTSSMTSSIAAIGAVGSANLTSPYTVTTSTSPNTVVGGGFTMGTTYTPPWLTQSNVAPKINLDGEGADIVVNGHSLVDAINNINDRLNCLQINPQLEAEWAELKALGDRYRELEAKCLEKAKMWKQLQS